MVRFTEVLKGIFEVRVFSTKFDYETHGSHCSWQVRNFNTFFTDSELREGTKNYAPCISKVVNALKKYHRCVRKHGDNRLYKIDGQLVNAYDNGKIRLVSFFNSVNEWKAFNGIN